jgi:hypothetical protein
MRFTRVNTRTIAAQRRKGRNEGRYEKQSEGAAPHGGRQTRRKSRRIAVSGEAMARLGMGAQCCGWRDPCLHRSTGEG